jgi:ATF/CREB family transcription factor
MAASRDTSTVAEPKSPNTNASTDAPADSKKSDAIAKSDGPAASVDASKALAPPPRPGQQGTSTPDYFSSQVGGSLSLEPNPFEQSFGGAPPETPGGTKLPPVAALTSPSSIIPGSGVTPFNWPGGSLRSGPLSPAMLSGPTTDYFGDTHHIRGGFPTPNESSLRTGLTPGGSGSMFPAPSPNSALLAQLAGGGATPSTLEFHRTAISAAAKRDMQHSTQAQPIPPTSQPTETAATMTSAPVKPEPRSGPFDPHDNDAANGLFMLAQGRNGAPNPTSFPVTTQPPVHAHPAPAPPQPTSNAPSQIATVNGAISGTSGSARGSSEAGSTGSEDNELPPRPATRGKGKRNTANGTTTTNGRRKAEETVTKGSAKKAKTAAAAAAAAAAASVSADDMSDDDGDMKSGDSKTKMTDEEKRRNFLERNRVAALKCRQRKKQWLASLQSKVELFSNENEALSAQIAQLREEVVNLKTLLLAHKDCPVTQQQASLHGPYMQVVEPYSGQMNPYGMAAPPMPAQAVMAGQPVQRRFS